MNRDIKKTGIFSVLIITLFIIFIFVFSCTGQDEGGQATDPEILMTVNSYFHRITDIYTGKEYIYTIERSRQAPLNNICRYDKHMNFIEQSGNEISLHYSALYGIIAENESNIYAWGKQGDTYLIAEFDQELKLIKIYDFELESEPERVVFLEKNSLSLTILVLTTIWENMPTGESEIRIIKLILTQ